VALFSNPENSFSPLASMKGDHAGLRMPDFDAAVAWYTEKLDFRLTVTTEAVGLKWDFFWRLLATTASRPKSRQDRERWIASPPATWRERSTSTAGITCACGWTDLRTRLRS